MDEIEKSAGSTEQSGSVRSAERNGTLESPAGKESRIKKAAERFLADIRRWRVGLIIFILYWTGANLIFHAYCPLRLLTGIPCPGCGLTKAGASALLLHFSDAWDYHPMIFLILPALLYTMVFRYLLGKRVPGGRGIAILLLAALFVIYPIRMRLLFPDDHGLYLYEQNLSAHFVPGWNAMITQLFGRY